MIWKQLDLSYPNMPNAKVSANEITLSFSVFFGWGKQKVEYSYVCTTMVKGAQWIFLLL